MIFCHCLYQIYLDDARMESEKYQQEMKDWEDRMKELGREDLIRKGSRPKTPRVRATKAKKVTKKVTAKQTVTKAKSAAAKSKTGTQKTTPAKSKSVVKKASSPRPRV